MATSHDCHRSFFILSFGLNLISNEDYGYIISVAEVPIDGVITLARCCTLSFSERNTLFPGVQPCFTCTCKAA